MYDSSLPVRGGAIYSSRDRAKLSKAPAKARLSIVLRLQAERLIRSTKSKMSLYSPLASRSAMICSTAPDPTPFTALRPKRISPLAFTENFISDSFTSGTNTPIFMDLHSSMSLVISVMLFRFRLNAPAIYSAG